MIERIISGGQSGADRAALDTAIKFDIDHGGWLPKGRITEDGTLPLSYRLKEMDSADYRERTKQNIIDSQGTVILARGELNGGSKLTLSFARVVGRPNCHIDLMNHEEFEAAIILKSFVQENGIRILNVAGPRLSKDPEIYTDVKTILETALYLIFLDSGQDGALKAYIPQGPVAESFPLTLDEAVSDICEDLPLKTRTFIANLPQKDIHMIYFALLEYIRQRVGFDAENKALLFECSGRNDTPNFTVEDAVMKVLKAVKHHLEKDHILRLVK